MDATTRIRTVQVQPGETVASTALDHFGASECLAAPCFVDYARIRHAHAIGFVVCSGVTYPVVVRIPMPTHCGCGRATHARSRA